MNKEIWKDYSQPFGTIGPLMTVGEILEKNIDAGYNAYDEYANAALQKFARYASEFLSNPHPHLGRDGSVCPFVPEALTKGLLRVAASQAVAVDEIENDLARMLAVFSQMKPVKSFNDRTGDWIYKAIIIALPGIQDEGEIIRIGQLQKRLKPDFIQEGFMIGEFYPGCPEPGLHNRMFRPLDTTVPAWLFGISPNMMLLSCSIAISAWRLTSVFLGTRVAAALGSFWSEPPETYSQEGCTRSR
ncbi:hypothetical protein GGE68_006684 [Rhizobium leguminosarum]|uniref:DUF6875 domain-containing protein n=1 Tax=Rhizobium leguminosarum TaxID=384 RepID=UPI0017BD6705|nr:hypothetical protein [Rhizobium leguminosarum]MBB5668424.1 hypothetical protein [Rhizobium leguminosarum]